MDKVMNNLLLFLMIVFFIYLIFSNMSSIEGMTTDSSSNTTTSSGSSENGIAGNASSYVAAIKAQTIKLQDTLLISKYRKDYENVVISLDDLVNNLMLKTALNVNKGKPQEALKDLVSLNESKAALNNVMKFIDASA
jgi:hypothetical protein